MSRASLMLLAMLVLHVLLGWVCLVVSRGERRSRGLWLWGWGLLLYAAGLLITIPPFIPFDLRKVVGNALIAFAPIACAGGLLDSTGWRLHRGWVTAGFLASVLPIVVNHVSGRFIVLVDLLAPAPLSLVLFFLAAFVLLRHPPAEARAAARFLSAIMFFTATMFLARAGMILLSVGGSNDRERADLVIALFSIAQLITGVGCTLGLLWVEVRLMQAELERIAFTDALTGLPNRRATMQRFAVELSRASRQRQPLAVVVFDIDHFKRFNDTYGHQVGDDVLRHVAALAAASVRGEDAAGRIGGEEFVLLLPGQDAARATEVAERLRRAVETTPLHSDAGALAVTLSGGVGVYPQDGEGWDPLFAAADERLYEAKRAGRNRIVAAGVAA